MEAQEKQNKSRLLLEYMMSEGFNPNNYKGVLELLQSAPNSISRYLTDYNQYLLSKEVVYSELEKYGIDGAYGYLTGSKIYVPKTFGNDIHFLYNAPKVPYIRHDYGYPCLDEFGTTIFSQESVTPNTINTIINSLKVNKDHFFGFILGGDKDNQEIVEIIQGCYQIVKNMDDSYKFGQTTQDNNQLYLIKKMK